ncbi:glycyl-radical enzyme activating protein [Clostridiales bacterium COT073_COT-073]|nr:glycyl-radical enzyme activating protein [Clostridiales bacterium COT073_COT-073]
MPDKLRKEKGLLLEIQRFCLHDGPGIRTTVFFKGCPLQCKWCANPESQSFVPQLQFSEIGCIRCGRCIKVCPVQALWQDEMKKIHYIPEKCIQCQACAAVCPSKALRTAGKSWTVEDAVYEILKDKVFFREGGGVTFSGGEVLAQIDFAEALANALHRNGIHITCETSGYSSEETFARMLKWCDLLYLDLKHWDSQKHKAQIGVGNEVILQHLTIAQKAGIPLVIRIPVIPRYNDSPADWQEFSRLLTQYQVKEVHLLPFHQFGAGKYTQFGMKYEYAGYPSLAKEDLTEFAETLSKVIPKVQIGG